MLLPISFFTIFMTRLAFSLLLNSMYDIKGTICSCSMLETVMSLTSCLPLTHSTSNISSTLYAAILEF